MPENSTISVELPIDLRALHPHDRALEVDVLSTGQILMKASGHFNQGTHASPQLTPSLRRAQDFLRSFRTVDLPAPFGPMIPSASPRRVSREASLSAQNSSLFNSCSARTARLMSDGIRSRSAVWRSVRRKRFHTCSNVMPGCPTSDVLRELIFRTMEYNPADCENNE